MIVTGGGYGCLLLACRRCEASRSVGGIRYRRESRSDALMIRGALPSSIAAVDRNNRAFRASVSWLPWRMARGPARKSSRR
jgi:hypothetical protein